MAQSLAELLTTAAPRERMGSQTAARYDFQANYGILKLVELQETGSDFRMVFDLFDDIVVLDSADHPTEIRLYQIKSKDPGEWSGADLCGKQGVKPPRSIISRMYAHVQTFGIPAAETGFVSNAPYRVRLQDGSTSTGTHHLISGIQLHADEVKRIQMAVEDDIMPADIPAWLPKLALIRTTLTVHGQELVVLGRLQQHIDQVYGMDGVKIRALYETLHASISERTKFSEEGLPNEAMLARKSLTQQELQDLLATALKRRSSYLEDWETIRADLINNQIGTADQLRLRNSCIIYSSDRNAGQANALALSDRVANWKANNAAAINTCTSVLGLVKLMQDGIMESFGYSDLQIRAAFIVEAHEAINESA